MGIESDFTASAVTRWTRASILATEPPEAESGNGGEALYPKAKGPVVTFVGWVQVEGDLTRIYVDSWFTAWLEIPTAAIVHQVPGDERRHDNGRSLVWVLADTTITSCHEATARVIANANPDAPINGFGFTELANVSRVPWPRVP